MKPEKIDFGGVKRKKKLLKTERKFILVTFPNMLSKVFFLTHHPMTKL